MKKFLLCIVPTILMLNACRFVELSDVEVTKEFESSQTFHTLEASGDVHIYMETRKNNHYYVTNSNLLEYVHVYQKDSKLTAIVESYTIWPSASVYYTKVYIPEEHGLSHITLRGSAQFDTESSFLDDKLYFNLSSSSRMGTEKNPVVIQHNQQIDIRLSGNSVMYLFCNGSNNCILRGQLSDNARLYLYGTPKLNDITCLGESAIIRK